MKHCTNCNAKLHDDEFVCPICGNQAPLPDFQKTNAIQPTTNHDNADDINNATHSQTSQVTSTPTNLKNYLSPTNKIAKTLYVIGCWILICGIIGSFFMGEIFPSVEYKYSYYSGYSIKEAYNWELVITSIVTCIISGVCFIGFSEIIYLLQNIANSNNDNN